MHYIRNTIEFVLISVILKVIVAHWLAKQLMKLGDFWLHKTERNVAIWTHINERVNGAGHAGHLGACRDGKCSLLA